MMRSIPHSSLVPLLMDIWVGALILAIINNAAVNIGVYYLFESISLNGF